MANPDKFERLVQGATAAQTITTIATTLGIFTLAHSGWKRITLSYDERLLIEIAKHKASQDRADEILASIDRFPVEDVTRESIKDLADQLDTVANRSLKQAVATAKWNSSKWRVFGQISLFLIFLSFYADFLSFSMTKNHHSREVIAWCSLVLITIASIPAIAIFTVIKLSWINAEMNNDERWYHPHTR